MNTMTAQVEQEVTRAVLELLEQERSALHLSSYSCIPPSLQACAHVTLSQRACVAGLPFLPLIFSLIDPSVQVALHVEEGQECEAHTVLASLSGSARSILSGERAALHILQYLSGVATWTALLIKEAAGHHCAILDGEGAPPCLRHLQRYALQVGGGKDRCEGTQRAVRVKLNHAALVSLQEAVRAVREQCADARIEVEIDAIGQLEAALACTPNAIVLDNLDLSAVREAVRRARGKVFLEAAGSMTLAKVRAYAAAGVSGVSIGALTHAPQAVDIAFKMDTTQL